MRCQGISGEPMLDPEVFIVVPARHCQMPIWAGIELVDEDGNRYVLAEGIKMVSTFPRTPMIELAMK